MKIHKGDNVKVISGQDKGIQGIVLNVLTGKGKILVENVNIVTKHMKKTGKSKAGIVKTPRPINISNVQLICPKCKKTSRIGYKVVDGKKYRICKKCLEVIKKS